MAKLTISQLVNVILFPCLNLVIISNPLQTNDATSIMDIKIKPSIIFELKKAGYVTLEEL